MIVKVGFKKSWSAAVPFETIWIGDFEKFRKQEQHKTFFYNTNLKKMTNPCYFTIGNGQDENFKIQYEITKLEKGEN
jgi:hypothetical protein